MFVKQYHDTNAGCSPLSSIDHLIGDVDMVQSTSTQVDMDGRRVYYLYAGQCSVYFSIADPLADQKRH